MLIGIIKRHGGVEMNKTSIEWVKNPDGTQGYTWNPITGCLNGCEYCYARKLANTRLKERYLANKYGVAANERSQAEYYENRDNPFYPRFWEDRVDKMSMYTGVGKGIFTCDMSDLFGIGVPEQWTNQVLQAIKFNPRNRFYLLTKQPQNLIKFSPFPENCWVGVTVCNDKMLDVAVDKLEDTQAKVKYLSLEPLQEKLTLSLDYALYYSGVSWVIIGSQTKPTVYPKIEWAQEIVQACDKAGVKVFIKNNLAALARNIALYPNMKVGDIGWDAVRQELPE